MEVITELLHRTRKGGMINALEKFHIYKETKTIKLVKSVR